ncbi:50S ribosomal protein L10, partial [Halobacteriales archaeon SW_7_68_16]
MSAERKTETIPEWKRDEIDEIVDIVERHDSIGIVDVTAIPSRQLQAMRRDLHGRAQLRMSRNTLLIRALEETGYDDLVEFVSGHVGIIGTDDNPFGLYRQLEASKTPAPIGAGEIAPNDIVVPEGDTGVDPGPFVGDLQNVGAAARIQEGSIHVTEDSTVLGAGEEVSNDLANVLSELGIEPKEVGLDLRAVSSDGVVFLPDELAIDIDEYRADVETAAARARNLSLNAVHPTAATAPGLLSKGRGEAMSLALHAAIEEPDVVPDLVRRADGQVRALAARIDDEEALPEDLRDVEIPDAGDDGVDEVDDADDEQTDDHDSEADD